MTLASLQIGLRKAPSEPITVTLYPQSCLRCGLHWRSEKPRPVMCPRCKIRAFDKSRKFYKASKPGNEAFVSNQMDRDPKPYDEYRSYPMSKIEQLERDDEKKRLEAIKAMSAVPDSEKRRYPCFNSFYLYPYPKYEKDGKQA